MERSKGNTKYSSKGNKSKDKSPYGSYYPDTEELNSNGMNNFKDKQLIEGNPSNAMGSTDYFSFKIRYTQLYEPYVISLYSLNPDKYGDRFASSLLIRCLYFSKQGLFNFLRINPKKQTNFLLYTDESINAILQEIVVNERGAMFLNNNYLINSLINV